MTAQNLKFTDELLRRSAVSASDAETTLEHFAIVSYAIPPERVRPYVHPSFDLDCIEDRDGKSLVCVSMVPFEDRDFRNVTAPWLRFRFGQTNYRTYVIDRETGRRGVWFFGTTLDSWTVAIPRYIWKLPWHRGRIHFDCTYDSQIGKYSAYRMTAHGDWGPVELELEDSGKPVSTLIGFGDLEAGLVAMTHPLDGIYFRRDGKLGTYKIWHDRLSCSSGHVLKARIGLFDRMGLVPYAEQLNPHSVLIQRRTEFTIHLPPKLYSVSDWRE